MTHSTMSGCSTTELSVAPVMFAADVPSLHPFHSSYYPCRADRFTQLPLTVLMEVMCVRRTRRGDVHRMYSSEANRNGAIISPEELYN